MKKHSFSIVLSNLPETMWKLCLSTKFSHQEIRWNYGIFHSDILQGYSWCLRRFYEGIINYFEASNWVCIWFYKFVAANYPLRIRNFFYLAVSGGFIFLWRLPQTSLPTQCNIYHVTKSLHLHNLNWKRKLKSDQLHHFFNILITWNQMHHFTQH